MQEESGVNNVVGRVPEAEFTKYSALPRRIFDLPTPKQQKWMMESWGWGGGVLKTQMPMVPEVRRVEVM